MPASWWREVRVHKYQVACWHVLTTGHLDESLEKIVVVVVVVVLLLPFASAAPIVSTQRTALRRRSAMSAFTRRPSTRSSLSSSRSPAVSSHPSLTQPSSSFISSHPSSSSNANAAEALDEARPLPGGAATKPLPPRGTRLSPGVGLVTSTGIEGLDHILLSSPLRQAVYLSSAMPSWCS